MEIEKKGQGGDEIEKKVLGAREEMEIETKGSHATYNGTIKKKHKTYPHGWRWIRAARNRQ